MDHPPQPGSQPPCSSSTKVERRLVEKNRRNQMKILYSKLNSLLPSHNPKEAVPLPDQIDEAINYIKRLEGQVKMVKEKKERLLMGTSSSSSSRNNKRSRGGGGGGDFAAAKPPQFEIHETGSSLEIVLRCGLESQFIFSEIIRVLHEENVDVRSANSSLAEDSVLHVVHAEIPQSSLQFGATRVSERLKRFVNGSSSDVEIQPALWDFEIGTDDLWGF